MASSELSSSDIRGHDAFSDGPRASDAVPLPNHTAPAPEDSFWKKYSSHYEFPLSLMIALGIHVLAVLVVLAYMTIQFHWGDPKQPVNGIVVIEQPRQEGDDDQERPGGGSDEPTPFAQRFDPLNLEKLESVQKPDPAETSLLPAPLPVDRTESLRKKQGGPGTGIGEGAGPGAGPGDGAGVEMSRSKRWKILFSYDEPELFLSQLANLQVTVAGRLNNGRFIVYQNLSETTPLRHREMTGAEFSSFVNDARKLWFINNDRATCENFAYAVQQSERILTLALVIPQEMENAILLAETRYHNMTEDEIRTKKLETSFRVTHAGGQWNVAVVKSTVRK